MSLKHKTISGLFWSFIDNFAKLGISFVVGIILARLLTPREFGLIGMITIFIAVSQSFIDSGFTQALIRKQNCTQTDYSTVFFFNLLTSIVFSLLLFFSAKTISNFFDEPKLILLVQILSVGLIINSFTIVQRAKLTKRIDFKLQTKISVVSSIGSGIIGIAMAYKGFGVWSLVAKTIADYIFNAVLLWFWNKWIPSFVFSFHSLRDMFSFGSKLLVSGLINTIYKNIYLLIIGKYFSATELGYYTRANQFKILPSQNITLVIQQVSYPVLSTIQNDIPRLRSLFEKLIKSTMLITFVLMIGMAAVAKPMVLTLIGEKWLPSVVYLQLLCFVGMLYPLHALNLNMLIVQGRSDLFLRLEIIKKILAIPVIIIGIFLGIKIMIIGMLLNSIIAYFLNSYWSGKHIGYSSLQQLKDILPSFLIAFLMGVIVYSAGLLLSTPVYVTLILQLIIGAVVVFIAAETIKMNDYLYIKNIMLNSIFRYNEQ